MVRRLGRPHVVLIALLYCGGFFIPALRANAAAAPAPLLRIVHASSDAPAIDAFINGQKVGTAQQFAAVTPYTPAPAGGGNLQVISAGAGPGGTALISTPVDLRDGGAYTIVAADRLKAMAPVILDDTMGVANDGQAHVRLVHVSPDAPPVADVAVVGGPVVARNLAFKGATGYLAVPPGTYAFEIRPSGTTQAVATTPAITVDPDRSYSAFVMGQLGDNTFRAVIAVDNAASGGVGGAPSAGGGGMATTQRSGLPLAGGLSVACLIALVPILAWRRSSSRRLGR